MARVLPDAVAARWRGAGFSFGADRDADDIAEVTALFEGGVLARSSLSWRAAERRTSAKISGILATLEVDGEHVTLTDRDGRTEDLSVPDAEDDSYHPSWFRG